MDSRTEYVNFWLKDKSGEVGILLMCGMGGTEKTTITKFVFNSNYGRFDTACFLQNISEVAKGHNGLVRLQRQLLSDILRKEERKVTDVDDGCRRMMYALRNKRVLVLDDVDHKDQLFALAGQQDCFSEGSKIIITTRLKSLMKNSEEIYNVYWPEKLSDDESLELFSWHAFRQKRPIQSHVALSKRYDIFLSFKGLDTRKKFTDHLYHTLMRKGFQTFRDDDEIDKGEDIKFEMRKAIQNSRMSVIVLSENYANSMACLFELQTILELCKKSDHFVLPVFYEVEPEVLKEQSKNLVFEKKEATVERVKGWNAALKEVAGMAGMVSRKESDG
ncbi:hypothetical protein RHMOL_Rhmol11G0210200 [Rhododendron molle]|uniref:Uncharacterized protein n=1 Tax=Rhododendron molle TaxID=49168 RepID=A0ACC0LUJ0_RHOML|nr:hypothetical protein RHMOL_Rhmol11G0210200 [Rhododendron molle]